MVDTAIHNIAVSKFTHTFVDYKSTGRKEVTPMAYSGCVANYANHLASRSSNLDWKIRVAMSLVADRYADINNVTHHEAIMAYRFLKSVGIKMTITENHL